MENSIITIDRNTLLRTDVNVKLQKLYYETLKFKLYQGNCLDVLKGLPENSVDMVFADPPYNLSNGGFTVHAGRRMSVNKGEWDNSNGLKNYEINF